MSELVDEQAETQVKATFATPSASPAEPAP